MKREAFNHSKLAFLADLLECDLCEASGILVRIWHLTAEETPAGNIGKLSNHKIRSGIGSRRTPDKLIAALLESEWLDEHPEHRLVIHDWKDHCEDTVHNKLARTKQFFVDGTPPKLTRLQMTYKGEAEAFYAQNVRTQNVPDAHTSSSRAHERSSGAHISSVRTTVPGTGYQVPSTENPLPSAVHREAAEANVRASAPAHEAAAAPPPATFEVGQIEKTPSQTAAFAWYREHVDSQSFLLFGRMMKATEVSELVDQAALWHENGIQLDENLIKRAVAECLNWCEVNQRKRATIGALITSLSLIVEVDRETQPNSAANGHNPARRVRNQPGQDRQTVPDSQPRDLDPDLSRYVWGSGP